MPGSEVDHYVQETLRDLARLESLGEDSELLPDPYRKFGFRSWDGEGSMPGEVLHEPGVIENPKYILHPLPRKAPRGPAISGPSSLVSGHLRRLGPAPVGGTHDDAWFNQPRLMSMKPGDVFFAQADGRTERTRARVIEIANGRIEAIGDDRATRMRFCAETGIMLAAWKGSQVYDQERILEAKVRIVDRDLKPAPRVEAEAPPSPRM